MPIHDSFLFDVGRAFVLSLTATGLLWFVLRYFRQLSPSLHRGAWFGVLLLGLCVFRFSVDVPVYEPIPVPEPTVAVTETLPRHDVFVEPVVPPAVFPVEPSVSAPQEEPKKALPSPAAGLMIVWMGGVGVLLLRRVFLSVRLAWKLANLERVEEPADETPWRELLRESNVSPVKIPILWTDNAGPALVRSWCGYRLLIPKTLWEEITDRQKTGILRHELCHYLHGDVWAEEIARFLAVLQWFNPAAWLALHKFAEATEWRCDDFSYGVDETGPKDLIETLLSVHQSTESLGLYLSSFARLNVIKRINRLLETSRSKETAIMKKTFLFVLMLLFFGIGLVKINLVAQQPAQKPEAASPAPEKAPQQIVFTFRDEDGKPCKDVKLFIHKVWGDAGRKNVTMKSDDEGKIVFDLKEIESPNGSFQAYAELAGFSRRKLRFHPKYGTWPIPESFEIVMERGRTIGGTIVDENGQPIAEASVRLTFPIDIYPDRWNPIYASSIHGIKKTDAEGKWSCDTFPKGFYYGLFQISAPGYLRQEILLAPETVPDEFKDVMKNAMEYYGSQTAPLSELLAKTAVMTLKKGITIRGKVVGPDGKPVENPRVTVSNYTVQPRLFVGNAVDKAGNIEARIPTPMEVNIGVWADKMAPELFVRNIAETNEPFEFRLKPGKSIRFRIVDAAKKPLENVMVLVHTGKEGLWLGNCLDNSNAEGRISWEGAPEETIRYTFRLSGYRTLDEVPLEPRDEEHVVVMQRTDANPSTDASNSAKETEPKTVTIRGRVFLPDGSPAKNQWVTSQYLFLDRNAGSGGLIPVREQGEYSAKLPVGTRLTVIAANRERGGSEWLAGGLASPIMSAVVSENPIEGQYDLHLKKGIRVSGTMRYEDGTPAAGKTLMVTLYGFDGKRFPLPVKDGPNDDSYYRPNCYQHVWTNKDGRYTLWLLPGLEYELEQEDSPGENRRQTLKLADDEKERTVDYTLPQPTLFRFTLPDGTETSDVDVDICSRMDEHDNRNIVGLKPEPDGDFRAVLSSVVNLVSVKTKDGKFGANLLIQGDERLKPVTVNLQAPVVGKVRFVDKETGKPIVGRKLSYYPFKRIHDNLLLMNSHRPERVQTDENGVVTLPLMFVGADYSLYDGYDEQPRMPKVIFTPAKPGETVDLGTIEAETISSAAASDFGKNEKSNPDQRVTIHAALSPMPQTVSCGSCSSSSYTTVC